MSSISPISSAKSKQDSRMVIVSSLYNSTDTEYNNILLILFKLFRYHDTSNLNSKLVRLKTELLKFLSFYRHDKID